MNPNMWAQLQMMGQRQMPAQGGRPMGFPGQGGAFPGQGAPVQGGFPGGMRPGMQGQAPLPPGMQQRPQMNMYGRNFGG